MIWNRLPKTVFVGADVLTFEADDAVTHFNIGNKAAENIISELGLMPGHFFTESLRKGDTLRVKKAGHRNTYYKLFHLFIIIGYVNIMFTKWQQYCVLIYFLCPHIQPGSILEDQFDCMKVKGGKW